MATIVIKNVPETIIKKYWEIIQYSKDIDFSFFEKKQEFLDEQAFNQAVKTDKIKWKLNLLASKI